MEKHGSEKWKWDISSKEIEWKQHKIFERFDLYLILFSNYF